MPRRYRHLTFEERCQVEVPKRSGLSRGSIAQHPALISIRTALTGMRQGVALQIRIGETLRLGRLKGEQLPCFTGYRSLNNNRDGHFQLPNYDLLL